MNLLNPTPKLGKRLASGLSMLSLLIKSAGWFWVRDALIEPQEFGIESAQFDSGVGRLELPVDRIGGLVASRFPGGHFAAKKRSGLDAAIQTLTTQHAQLALGDVQPTAVFRSVVNFQAVGQPVGFCGIERFVERSGIVSIQVVHDQNDLHCIRVKRVNEIAQGVRPVNFRATFCHANRSPARQRLAEHEQVAGAVANVLAVDAKRVARTHGQRLANFTNQLL